MTRLAARAVLQAPDAKPFVGVSEMVRERGKPFALRLGANESPFGSSPRVGQAIAAAAGRVHYYGDPSNHDLQMALAAQLGLDPGRLLVAGGIDELLGLAVRLLLNPGDVAIASAGAYPTFAYHVQGFGGKLATVPYRAYHNDLDALVHKASTLSAKLLYLANPDNPTGTLVEPDAIRCALQQFPGIILLDEAYADFAPGGSLLNATFTHPRLLRFRTFSKARGLAGLRVGYLFGDPQLIQLLHRIRLHFGVNNVAQAAALAALADTSFLQQTLEAVQGGKQAYRDLGARLGLSPITSHANFVLFDCGTPTTAQRIHQRLLDLNVFVRRAHTPPFDQCLRVTVARADQLEDFAKALQKASI